MLIQQQMSTHYTSIAQQEPPSPKSQNATMHFRFQENGNADWLGAAHLHGEHKKNFMVLETPFTWSNQKLHT
jgi:hypothetical protein